MRVIAALVSLAVLVCVLILAGLLVQASYANAQDSTSAGSGETLADLLVRGADLQYRGEPAAAAEAFSRALELDPSSLFAQDQLALALAKQGEFARSLELFSRIASEHPEDSFAGLWQGVLLLNADRADEAVAAFNRVLDHDPASADAHYFLGVVDFTERRALAAADHFMQAQALGSDDPETHFRLARAFRSLSMEANAMLELCRALELDPAHADAWRMLGWLLHARGEIDAAVEAWERALDLLPGDAESRANIARVRNEQALDAWQAGQKDRARILWRQVLSVDPANRAARDHLERTAEVAR